MGTMTRTREAAATRLIAKFEKAISEMHDVEQLFSALPPDVAPVISEECGKARTIARRRYNMLRGTLWRALVNSTEEL